MDDVPLPPGRMPMMRGGRPLKRWIYVGAFGPGLKLCAAVARIGPLGTAWWAVWDGHRLAEGRRGVAVTADRATVRGRLELELDLGTAIEVVSPHGDQYAWTRKRVARARGRFDGRAIEVVSPHGDQYAWTRKRVARARGQFDGRAIELGAIVDESAGYHARHTAWRWSAGVGTLESGEEVAWNLVDGIHDALTGSERAVWVGGRPHEVGPVHFADDLSAVSGLRFAAEATRARRENYLVIRSDYEQPFGTFSGELPLAGPLREGWGVMERHDVRW